MTALDHDTDLDVDLEKAIPCGVVGCDREATWRVYLRHREGGVCQHTFHCDPCRQRKASEVASVQRFAVLACRHGRLFCTIEWSPL